MARQRGPIARRSFVRSAAAGLGLALTGGLSRADAAEWTATEKANVQVVNAFCAAWASRDLAKITAPFADTVTYRPVETAEPIKGQAEVTARIKTFIDRVKGFDVLETFAKGPMVVNERKDYFTSGQLKSWHGVGVFFLKDGKIVDWYDYTIAMDRA